MLSATEYRIRCTKWATSQQTYLMALEWQRHRTHFRAFLFPAETVHRDEPQWNATHGEVQESNPGMSPGARPD